MASAAASPPLEPPGVKFGFQGFLVLPRNGLSVSSRKPNSGKFVRAIGIAPALIILSTIGALLGGIASAKIGSP